MRGKALISRVNCALVFYKMALAGKEKPMTADEKEKVVELRLKGLGYQAIANEIGTVTKVKSSLLSSSYQNV